MFRAVDPGVLKPISNPPNPWSTTEVEYLEEAPPARLEVYEDHTREILSHNDSPDVGFSWSVNPYRGCFHACAYCLSGDTSISKGESHDRGHAAGRGCSLALPRGACRQVRCGLAGGLDSAGGRRAAHVRSH